MATVKLPAAVREETHGRRLQDELLFDLINRAPDAMAIIEESSVSTSYELVYVNEAFYDLYRASKDEVIGNDIRRFMSSRSTTEDLERNFSLLKKGESFIRTRCFERSDGKTVWLEVNFRPIIMQGQPVRWIFIARDITSKKILQDRATQLSIAVEEGNDLVAINVADKLKSSFRFSYVNEAFFRTTGYRPDELLGKPLIDFIASDDGKRRFRELREMLYRGIPVRDEMRLRCKDGRVAIFDASITPSKDPITKKYASIVSILRDVTEVRLLEERLQYEAEHDLLTGLHNRRHFERMLRDSKTLTEPVMPAHALIFIDLDGFKAINDRFGHEFGDEVLRRAAAALKRTVFGSDVLVRWGGDEFAALLFHCHMESARRTASSMLAELSAACEAYAIGASIGVAAVVSGEPMAESIRRADKACYAAKGLGGNQVFSSDLSYIGEPSAGP